MREDTQKTKLAKLSVLIAFLSILILVSLVLLAYDLANPISSKELSKAAASKLSTAIDEVQGAKGKVIAKYVDTNGNEISESTTVEGAIGDEYKVERKDIGGYKAYGEEPYAKTGNYTQEDIVAEFVYQKESENVDVNSEKNIITVKVKSEKPPKDYSLKIITKDEDGNLVKGVDYTVSKGDSILRSGEVQGDSFVAGTLTVNKEGIEALKISENPGTYYETLVAGDIEFNIIKTWNSEKGEYEISLDYDKSLNEFEIEIKDSEIIVTITNKLKVTIPENDKIFDLKITKYISNVKIDNGKAIKEVNRTIDNKDSILKIEVASKEVERTKVRVTYKLLVENVGNVPGYATEITDYIPQNFYPSIGDDWSKVSGKVITDSLAETLLNPGESKELEVEFVWELNGENVGVRKNIAEITNYKNDLDLKDFTPDNTGSAEMIVTIKTGGEKVALLGIIITLTVLAVVIYKEREKVKNED